MLSILILIQGYTMPPSFLKLLFPCLYLSVSSIMHKIRFQGYNGHFNSTPGKPLATFTRTKSNQGTPPV